VFLGPTLLAVGFRLVSEWSAGNAAAAGDVEPGKESGATAALPAKGA
jgi:hypothetical protein